MNVPFLKYLVLSDIHLGHSKNNTSDIIENLKNYFLVNHNKFKNLDMIVLAGDIFHKLLVTNSRQYLDTVSWLSWLLLYCSKHNIKLRILEGTPSHDWQQAKIIDTILKEMILDIDYKYIDTLHIEIMDDYGISILYVPDEWKHHASDTLKDVKELMKSNNLEQVDIAIMHGQFHYQIPMVVLDSSHDEKEYLRLVKYFISIGHIHTHSVFSRIIAQGSFDRLAHNEEEKKGGVLITLDPTLGNKYEFIENKKSKIFKTIRTNVTTLDELIIELKTKLIKLPKFSYIRVITDSNHKLNRYEKEINKIFIDYYISIESNKKEDKKKTLKLVTSKTNESFKIDPSNIKDLLDTEMLKHNLNKAEHDIYVEELKEVI